jgi:hypothetical protein
MINGCQSQYHRARIHSTRRHPMRRWRGPEHDGGRRAQDEQRGGERHERHVLHHVGGLQLVAHRIKRRDQSDDQRDDRTREADRLPPRHPAADAGTRPDAHQADAVEQRECEEAGEDQRIEVPHHPPGLAVVVLARVGQDVQHAQHQQCLR